MKTTTAFAAAIDALAQDELHRQFPEGITADQALDYVDDKLAGEWLKANDYDRSMLLEVIEKRFTDDTAKDLFAAILNAMLPTPLANHAGFVGTKLVDAVCRHIAEDLAYEAQQVVDNYCPSDEEMNRPFRPNDIDDPLLAERRSFTRAHNASISGWRRV
jgi:hypothetical protein